MKKIIILLIVFPCLLIGQEEGKPDPFESLEYFVGEWESSNSGPDGTGITTRVYEFILGGKYLHFKNKSVFPPSENNPDGEVHEDWGFFSYDGMRKKIILRQFHIEGFVNRYTIDNAKESVKEIILISESIENLPEGFRARYTINISDNSAFSETFDIAGPGKEFQCLMENKFKRKE